MAKMRKIPVYYKIKVRSKFNKKTREYNKFNEGDYIYGVIQLEYPSNSKDLNFYVKKALPLVIVEDEKYLDSITLISEKEYMKAKEA